MHMAQLMPLPLTVSCFNKIQISFTFLISAYPGSPGTRAAKRMYILLLTCSEELVVQNLLHVRPLCRLCLQQSLNQPLGRRRHALDWDVVLVLLDLGVGVLQTRRLKRRLAHQQCVPARSTTRPDLLNILLSGGTETV